MGLPLQNYHSNRNEGYHTKRIIGSCSQTTMPDYITNTLWNGSLGMRLEA